jgi:hypothetical protein
LAIVGLADAYNLLIYLFVPPHDGVQKLKKGSRFHACVVEGRKAPKRHRTVFIVACNGHYKALTMPNEKNFATSNVRWRIQNLFKSGHDVATGKCERLLSYCELITYPVRIHCVTVFEQIPLLFIAFHDCHLHFPPPPVFSSIGLFPILPSMSDRLCLSLLLVRHPFCTHLQRL